MFKYVKFHVKVLVNCPEITLYVCLTFSTIDELSDATVTLIPELELLEVDNVEADDFSTVVHD